MLLLLKQIMSNELLYDPEDTAVVVCDKDLEEALGMPTLHLSRLREVICKQINEKVPEEQQVEEISTTTNATSV